ncbi:lanthionine synthetase C family protein [Streptomyces albus]|uniref:Lanthionine synthetase C family protein n=1 Tax=Streptomyces albus (strain ATCC 21838 / DSM 41398 / FERM P-419 / JCM 4703 / NBRC 107858) TaxID=1081613 RepID=A0A0B5EJ49_STRA4|nr:lanthionine synthetase C family protein [Streptomyces albus]AOU75834.1 lanthionine synthetase C family protein [Streptomyces albus]
MTPSSPRHRDMDAVVAEIAHRVQAWSGELPPSTGPGLAEGHCGTALLFSELSRDRPVLRHTVHTLLAAEAKAGFRTGGHGLLSGLTGLGFVSKHAARTPTEYATLRHQVDASVRAALDSVLKAEHLRIADGSAPAQRSHFDAVFGAAGLGRYFLAEPGRDPRAVRDILGYLVALTDPVHTPSGLLPGWLAPPWTGQGHPDKHEDRLLDLGLAHGVAGPLALMALCWTQDIRVPGQDAAMRRCARWLLSWHHEDGQGGGWWPRLVSARQEQAEPRPRVGAPVAAWCYGTPGVARALQLAGDALGEEEWVEYARNSMAALMRSPAALAGVEEPGLCHGLAGIMQITGRMATDLDDPWLSARADELADRLCARFDPKTAFGYPTRALAPQRPDPLDAPTFLEGAAGIALALHDRTRTPDSQSAAAHGESASLPWDAALLLS